MTTATKAKRETWRDWMPEGADAPPVELTREEVIEHLAHEGVDVSPRTLMYWERESVIPHPVRRWQDGAPRVFYPPWIVQAVKEVRRLQDSGLELSNIAPRMRRWVVITTMPDPFIEPQRRARDAIMEYVRTHERFTGQRIGGVEVVLTDDDGNEIPGGGFGFAVTP